MDTSLPICTEDSPALRRLFVQMSAYIQQLEGQIGALQAQSQTRRSSMTSSRAVSSTYKVKNFEMAAKLAASDGTDDGLYNGLPIEVRRCVHCLGRSCTPPPPVSNECLVQRTNERSRSDLYFFLEPEE